jgi:hypothetical protein
VGRHSTSLPTCVGNKEAAVDLSGGKSLGRSLGWTDDDGLVGLDSALVEDPLFLGSGRFTN